MTAAVVPGRGPGAVEAEHTCPGCAAAVIPARTLVCRGCWRLVPRDARAEAWRAWRSGRWLGSAGWLPAVLRVLGAVQ